MTMLEEVKAFAEKNFSLPEAKQLSVETELFSVTNPWIDSSGRFPLTDEQAVKEWGLEAVIKFYEAAKEAVEDEAVREYLEAKRKNQCLDCPYMYCDYDDPKGNEYCHYDGPSNWAPCEEEEYYDE